ncbi:zinc finger transcription factor YY1-like isoform X2 [Primulina tabacum]|uniref:zinc finger transcription factor YY1-like isoform X2 n=1 Tax=Primulina tabacum TaxID=48773 RepID=UPI003F59F375
MDNHFAHNLFDRRSITKSRNPAVRWVREWVPQDLVATGGKCLVLKWVNEATLKAVKDKSKLPEAVEPEPEPTTEVLFLCSYEGCGKTFIDAGALRKHSHIHGERQYVCHYENCGKKFLDSSKLKRHFLIHTGERDFVCPHEGCGKENYHLCPYPECGKRYAHEYKLKNHIASHHEKNGLDDVKYTTPVEKPVKTSKSNTGASGPASSDRPFACPYEGCEKAYIHEYKLNLHLRREHPGHFPDDKAKNNTRANTENEIDEGSDQEAYTGKRGNGKVQKQSRSKPSLKMPPSKVTQRKTTTTSSANLNVVKKSWPVKDEMYDEEDSEETEEERDNLAEGGWRYGENNDDDEEETEDED